MAQVYPARRPTAPRGADVASRGRARAPDRPPAALRRRRMTGGRDVTVVGAGVVGLTCALRLAEAGHGVQVVARDRGDATTSSVAAAVWYPYRALPYELVLGWAETSYQEF